MRLNLNWVLGMVLLAGGQPSVATTLEMVAEQVEAGNYRAALATLDSLTGAQTSASQFLRANALAGSGQLDEAAEIFAQIIANNPELPEAYNNLAALRVRQGRLDDARELLEKALHTDERYARVQENLSLVYVEMARNSYAKALRLETGSQPPQLGLLTALSGHLVEETLVVAELEEPSPAVESSVSAQALVLDYDEPSAKPQDAVTDEPSLAEAHTTVAKADPVPVDEASIAEVHATAVEADSAPVTALTPATAESEQSASIEDAAVYVVETQAVNKLSEDQQQAVVTVLQAWASAWAQQDVDAYLAYYDAGYAPEGMTHKAWKNDRRKRIARPAWIKIELTDIQVDVQGPDVVSVELKQHYRSPSYKDTTFKHFGLMLQEGNWMIVSETNLKVVR